MELVIGTIKVISHILNSLDRCPKSEKIDKMFLDKESETLSP